MPIRNSSQTQKIHETLDPNPTALWMQKCLTQNLVALASFLGKSVENNEVKLWDIFTSCFWTQQSLGSELGLADRLYIASFKYWPFSVYPFIVQVTVLVTAL